VDRGDGTGCEKAERQNESCESVLLQHDSPPLFGSKASSRDDQFIAGAAKLKPAREPRSPSCVTVLSSSFRDCLDPFTKHQANFYSR
jgi:hypothetical protein